MYNFKEEMTTLEAVGEDHDAEAAEASPIEHPLPEAQKRKLTLNFISLLIHKELH